MEEFDDNNDLLRSIGPLFPGDGGERSGPGHYNIVLYFKSSVMILPKN